MSLAYFALDGKLGLVTGASSGLGRQFARSLARAGVRVAIAARRMERLESLAGEIADEGGDAVPVAMDVTDRVSVEAAFADIAARDGVPEIVVSNAGIGGRAPFLDYTPEAVERTFDTNIRGVWDVGQVAAQHMVRAGIAGSIVNVASIMGFGLRKQAASYCVSKAAVVQMTRCMACDLAEHGIRVNAIAPGYFATEMTGEFLTSEVGMRMTGEIPMQRIGEPEDLEGALLLLASPRGSYMTGATIVVDGGHLVAGM
jgi:NAD(P)-dependent dehydrogenase (short-subunit alcohol dehydrogenase family)